MQVLLRQRRSRDDEVEFVLVEPRLFHVDVGADLGDPLGQEVALGDEELAPEDLLRLREMRAQKLVWKKQHYVGGLYRLGIREVYVDDISSLLFYRMPKNSVAVLSVAAIGRPRQSISSGQFSTETKQPSIRLLRRASGCGDGTDLNGNEGHVRWTHLTR